MAATPEVRRRLLGLAVAVLAPAALPHSAGAQSTAAGSVRLVIHADALPPGTGEAEAEALLWMAPASAEETERLAGLWAAGDEVGALKAWRSVVDEEVSASRLVTGGQADAAARWIAARVRTISWRVGRDTPRAELEERAEEIRNAARRVAVASLEVTN